jgi:hypothetical protein
MTRYALALCVATAALAAPAAADDYTPVQPCPHASEFLLGYNRGAQVWIPGNEGPTKFCIEI